MKPPPALEFHDVGFTYRRSHRPALSGVHFSIPQGSFVGLVGVNGAGKSTLCFTANRIVPAFHQGSFSGRICVFGADIGDRSIADMATQVGMVFQDFEVQIFSTSVHQEVAFLMENLGEPRDRMIRKVAYWLDEMRLAGLENRDPAELSGGQKQRLVLASVLAANPPIIILDEPTTDLDPASTRELIRCLEKLAHNGATVVLATHDTNTLVAADQILCLSDGELRETGTPAQVLTRKGLLGRLGVQPPQLAQVFGELGLQELPANPEQAAMRLEELGYRVRPGSDPQAGRFMTAKPEVLSVEGLHFRYRNAQPLFEDLRLSVSRGEFVALLGQNGSGKTTLINLIARALRPHSGTIRIDGRRLDTIPPAERARSVGLVFQNPDHQIFCRTSLEEVVFGLRLIGVPDRELNARAMASLELVGLEEKAMDDPFTMTKGDRKKLAVASVLACEPRILLLDEPTTGLDAPEQNAMMKMVESLVTQGHTVLFITHAMHLAAAYAHRIVVLAAGQIVVDGPVPEVLLDEQALAKAGLIPPPAVTLGRLLGVAVRTPEELTRRLGR